MTSESDTPETPAQITTLEVHRETLEQSRIIEVEAAPLADGQVRLEIDRFAVTANNITYAVFGDMLGYWDFFPAGDPDWGRVPAMGWATVVDSQVNELPIGGRYYGWYPMASHVTFTPAVTADGFRDDGDHRKEHAPIYRSYTATNSDAMYPTAVEGVGGSIDDAENRHVLLRGLALTGFLAEEFFADGGGSDAHYFGTSRVVVLSASSKTALGFADRAARRVGLSVVGVTSATNREMVEATGYYDVVVSYDEIHELDTDGGAVVIDMAGNPAALRAVHERFGDGLAHSMMVGRSHHDAQPTSNEPLTGPTPVLFFAPTEVTRRSKQWGRDEYAQRCADAIASFAVASHGWLTIEPRYGTSGAQEAWADVYAGAVDPRVGIVVTMADDAIESR